MKKLRWLSVLLIGGGLLAGGIGVLLGGLATVDLFYWMSWWAL